DAGVDGVGIVGRRLEVPHALELPGARCAVVVLVRAGDALVLELVAGRLPGLAAVVRALHDLSGPTAGLGSIDAVRIGGRSLHMVDLPAGEVRSADFPFFALSVGFEQERAFARAGQHSYFTHRFFAPLVWNLGSSGVGSRSRHRRRASARTS